MKNSVGSALFVLAALLAVAALVHTRSSAAAKKSWPDLVVTKVVIKQLPGDPPYVIEDEAGHTPGFVVHVTTRNIGRARAKHSSTELEFSTVGGRRVRAMSESVPRLRPGATHLSVFRVALDYGGLVPPLGLLRVVATADHAGSVTESNEHNNTRRAAHLLPVIAHQWKVLDFMTTDDLNDAAFPGALESDFTKACWAVDCGRYFVFRFSTFDESTKHFVYVPDGTVKGGWDFRYSDPNVNCTGHAAETRGPQAWPGSLWIDDQLDHYEATVDVPSVAKPPPPAWVYCNSQPALQEQWAFQKLWTFVGEKQYPSMPSPYSTKLTGHTEKPGVDNAKTTWQWTFRADVPGAG